MTCPPKIVRERLGHSSVAFTMDTYAHVLPGTQAVAAERFDRIILAGLLESGETKKRLNPLVTPSSLELR